MKWWNLLFLVACRTAPSAPPSLTADQVTSELVDAGCLAPGDSTAVAEELATTPDPWLVCLFEGGTVAGCNVPCDQASARIRKR